MTLIEARELANLDRHIETVESLIPVRYPDATAEQFAHFRDELAGAPTTADKLDVTRDWLEWMVA